MARQPRSIFAKEEATAVVASARALVELLPEKWLLPVDAAWRLMRGDRWQGQRRREVIMGPVTSLWIAHDHCASEVFWAIPHHDDLDRECRVLTFGRDPNGAGLAATTTMGATAVTLAEAVVAVVMEASPDARVGETARAGEAAGIAAPTAAPEAEEEATEVVGKLGAAEPPSRRSRERGATIPREELTVSTGGPHTEAPTEQVDPDPLRTTERVPEEEEDTVEGWPRPGQWSHWQKGDTATPRAGDIEATGGSRVEACTEPTAPAPWRTTDMVSMSLS